MTSNSHALSQFSLASWLRTAVLIYLCCLIGCRDSSDYVSDQQPATTAPEKIEWVDELVQAENLILGLTASLKPLNESVNELSLPSVGCQSMFCDRVEVSSVGEAVDGDSATAPLGMKVTSFQIGAGRSESADELKLWQPMFRGIRFFQHARFYIVDGQFVDRNRQLFTTRLNFEGLAKLENGNWIAVHAEQRVTWREVENEEQKQWMIAGWEQIKLKITSRDRLLFREVTASAIDANELSTLKHSMQDQFVVRSFRNEPLELPYPELEPYFSSDCTMFHPSVSVVDINADGWDDLYLTTRWEKNRLFVNQQDGTFVNRAKEYGLDRDRTSCALFVDVDNDGDKDAFLGRCYAPSLLLINEKGKFVDRTSENIPQPLPPFITSASAADFDNDGLLDLYLCSYTSIGTHIGNVETASKFMPTSMASELIGWFTQTSPADLWLDRPGPPNRLLKNLGAGNFTKSTAIQEIWANSFQSTWSDYDRDGDVDLYISNDFAPDYLFRNDGLKGFTDVTRRSGGDAMAGYGMGVTWGDYDGDGWQDLYVSNMYSKAGKRIIGQMQTDLDARYLMSANGNRLFRNNSGKTFDLVSGEGENDIRVTRAGWSWGGQFCDFDNDGWLDLYVASGFYTAPQEISCHKDL